MLNIRELLRLSFEQNLSARQIGKAIHVSRSSVMNYIKAFQAVGISYADSVSMADDVLVNLLTNKKLQSERYITLINLFPEFTKQLSKKGVTLGVLWQEYREAHPDGYGYSQFCLHFHKWRESLKIEMHFEYKAGDKMFVDFTGAHMQITDRVSGAKQDVEIFIGILGCSQLTYTEATLSQKKEDFIRANENAFYYFGGVSAAIVPDCLKSGVTKADKYEPEINPEYQDFARHVGTVILPARPYEPTDKAHVEKAVQIIYTRVFAQLRNSIFYSLEELRYSDSRPARHS